jgi:hypothetical protein
VADITLECSLIHLSLPIGTLGLFKDKLTQRLFLESYEVSHQEHLKRFQTGRNFHELGEFFEFDLHLECNYVSNSTVPMSFLILRNRTERAFDRVEILVQASAAYVKYQDFTTLIDVGETPFVVYLPRIHLKEVEFTNSNRIITSYNEVTVTAFIHDGSISGHQSKAQSSSICPTYTEFLNSRWDKKWGTVWNLDYIESRKIDLRHTLQFFLVTRNQWPMEGEPRHLGFRIYKLLRLMIGAPLFRVLNRDWIISTIFWLPLILRRRKLEPKADD